MANWKGTTVPNTGYVEKIYFNIQMSVDEVVNELKKLTYILQDDGFNMAGLFSTVSGKAIAVLHADGHYFIQSSIGMLFQTITQNASFTGWNPDIISMFPDGGVLIQEQATNEMEGYQLGSENDKISSLFSITPFTQDEPITNLPEFLTGIADAIREVKGTTEKINAQNYKPEILKFKELIGSGGDPEWDGDYSEEGELPKPEGTLEITENGEYDVVDKASVNVSVAGSGGEDKLKLLFDTKQTCYYEFYNQSSLTDEQLAEVFTNPDVLD